MGRLDPDYLTVEFREGVYQKAPLIPRRYTFTRSEASQDLYLIIGPDFVYDKVSSVRNDVLGEWIIIERSIRYYVYLNMGKISGQEIEENRIEIRLKDLQLALEAFYYGDRLLFDTRPELKNYPIIVYFLYEDPQYNKAENWGTFADYDITEANGHVFIHSMMEHRVLIDEEIGDVNGDGIPDRVSVYGDKLPELDFIHSIIIEIEGGQSTFKTDMITELNGYNPTLFLGDFTKDHVDDIFFQMDLMFNSMNSADKGKYGVEIDRIKDNHLDMIFVSESYDREYLFLAEYKDFYKISILNTKVNKLFNLDISYKGYEYLSQFYNEYGELIKPMQAMVLQAGAFIPVVSDKKYNSYDLLAVHQIVGSSGSDTLGYIENLLSWNGEYFVSINMMVATTGINLINKY